MAFSIAFAHCLAYPVWPHNQVLFFVVLLTTSFIWICILREKKYSQSVRALLYVLQSCNTVTSVLKWDAACASNIKQVQSADVQLGMWNDYSMLSYTISHYSDGQNALQNWEVRTLSSTPRAEWGTGTSLPCTTNTVLIKLSWFSSSGDYSSLVCERELFGPSGVLVALSNSWRDECDWHG